MVYWRVGERKREGGRESWHNYHSRFEESTNFSMEDEDVEECIEEQDPVSHDTVGVEQHRLHNDSINNKGNMKHPHTLTSGGPLKE